MSEFPLARPTPRLLFQCAFTLSALLMVLGVALLTIACDPAQLPEAAAEPDRLQQLFDGTLPVIDLTHALSPEGPHWPSDSGNPFEYEVRAAHDSGATSMGAYATPEHHGTHIDAPIHSSDGQPSVDELDAGDLFGPIALIDVAAECDANADYLLSREDVLTWEARHGRLPQGAVVLMYTGWSRKWSDFDAYKNQDADGRMHFETGEL